MSLPGWRTRAAGLGAALLPTAGLAAEAQAPPLLAPTAAYTLDVMSDAAGGDRRGTVALDKLALGLAFDATRLGRPGLTAAVSVEHVNGASLSRLVGDLQTADNIEAPEAFRLFEAWVAQSFWNDRASVQVGVTDLNSIFDLQETAEVFLNSSHGIGPDLSGTGLNGPSIFPTTGFAAVGSAKLGGGWSVSAGAVDGVPGDPRQPRRTVLHLSSKEGALLIGEIDREWGDGWRGYVGGWTYTAAFDALDPAEGRRRDNRGAYAFLKGRLVPRGDKGGLSGWVRAGWAQADINPVASYAGAGLLWRGLGGRADDFAGLAVARAGFGGPARRLQGLEDAETALEATWGVQVKPSLLIQPDLQWIVHPGGRRTVGDALVFGVRFVAVVVP